MKDSLTNRLVGMDQKQSKLCTILGLFDQKRCIAVICLLGTLVNRYSIHQTYLNFLVIWTKITSQCRPLCPSQCTSVLNCLCFYSDSNRRLDLTVVVVPAWVIRTLGCFSPEPFWPDHFGLDGFGPFQRVGRFRYFGCVFSACVIFFLTHS